MNGTSTEKKTTIISIDMLYKHCSFKNSNDLTLIATANAPNNMKLYLYGRLYNNSQYRKNKTVFPDIFTFINDDTNRQIYSKCCICLKQNEDSDVISSLTIDYYNEIVNKHLNGELQKDIELELSSNSESDSEYEVNKNIKCNVVELESDSESESEYKVNENSKYNVIEVEVDSNFNSDSSSDYEVDETNMCEDIMSEEINYSYDVLNNKDILTEEEYVSYD